MALVRGKLDPGIRITLGALTVIDVHGKLLVKFYLCQISLHFYSFMMWIPVNPLVLLCSNVDILDLRLVFTGDGVRVGVVVGVKAPPI